MENSVLSKILIVGDAGRGKTSLAKKLSEKLGIPYHSTDDYLYEIKYSVFKEKQQALNEIGELYKQEKWIVEGTTRFLLNPGMKSADLIIHLKYNNVIHQIFILLRRHFIRKDKSLCETLSLMTHVIYKRFQTKKSRLKHNQMTLTEHVAPHKNKTVTITSFKEIDEFVESIK